MKRSGGQIIGKNIGKSDFFCMISRTLAKIGGGGAGYFVLQQNFTSKFLEH